MCIFLFFFNSQASPTLSISLILLCFTFLFSFSCYSSLSTSVEPLQYVQRVLFSSSIIVKSLLPSHSTYLTLIHSYFPSLLSWTHTHSLSIPSTPVFSPSFPSCLPTLTALSHSGLFSTCLTLPTPLLHPPFLFSTHLLHSPFFILHIPIYTWLLTPSALSHSNSPSTYIILPIKFPLHPPIYTFHSPFHLYTCV